MSPLLLLHPQWIHSFLLPPPNCCAWCSISLNFMLAVPPSNAPKSTTILKTQPLASSILPSSSYFVPPFPCSMLVFSSIFPPTTFCHPLATDCIHPRQNYAPFFRSWNHFLTWLTKLPATLLSLFLLPCSPSSPLSPTPSCIFPPICASCPATDPYWTFCPCNKSNFPPNPCGLALLYCNGSSIYTSVNPTSTALMFCFP